MIKVTTHNKQTQIKFKPMKEFEDKSLLLIARSLSDIVDDVVWVRVLNPTLQQKIFYKNATVTCAENIEKVSRIQPNIPDNITKHRDQSDFEKNAIANSKSLSREETNKMRSICIKYEVRFLRCSNDMGFCDQFYHKLN